MPESVHIKAVVFDAYGTLFDVASIDEQLSDHFGDKAPEVAALWRRKQLEYTWLRTLMNRYRNFEGLTRDALVYACEKLMLTIETSTIDDLMDHYKRLSVYPEVARALQSMSKHFKLAILSNANLNLLEQAVEHNEIHSFLNSIFSADEIGEFKPTPAVYQLPADGLRINKKEILFVSSNTWDVAGAKAAGMRVAWLKRRNDVMEQLGNAPDIIVGDLRELAGQLESVK